MAYITLGFEIDDPLERIALNNVADNHHIPTGRLLKNAVIEKYGVEFERELAILRGEQPKSACPSQLPQQA